MTDKEIKKIINKQTHKAAQIITKEVSENMFEQYQHYEKYKHEPVIVIEKCILDRLKQQLAIAVEALEKYADVQKLYLIAKDGTKIEINNNLEQQNVADQALQQIRELDK